MVSSIHNEMGSWTHKKRTKGNTNLKGNQLVYFNRSKELTVELSFVEIIQNVTIEERVTLLEIQVVEIEEDVTEIDERVELVEGDVNFLFDEQVIQDERLLGLEQENDVIDTRLLLIDNELESELWLAFKMLWFRAKGNV